MRKNWQKTPTVVGVLVMQIQKLEITENMAEEEKVKERWLCRSRDWRSWAWTLDKTRYIWLLSLMTKIHTLITIRSPSSEYVAAPRLL
jgi:hypothetical protein